MLGMVPGRCRFMFSQTSRTMACAPS